MRSNVITNAQKRKVGLRPPAAVMDNDKRDRQNREADAREIDRLRFLLKQAGIDAERILREIEATEQRHVREVTEERARTDEIRHRLKNTLAVVQAIANARSRPTWRWKMPARPSIPASKLSPVRAKYCSSRTGPEPI
jgi:hypothetical protein